MAACAAWTAGLAIAPASRLYLAAVAAAVVLTAEGFRRLDVERSRLMAAGELVCVLAIPLIGLALLGSGPDQGILLSGLVVAFAGWLLASVTLTDLAAVTEPTDLVEGISGAPGRLAGRFLLLGVICSLPLLAGHGGLVPVGRPRPAVPGLVLPYLVYWGVGLGGLAAIQRARYLARWRRDQAEVDAEVRPRWARATATWLLVGAGLAALLWWPERAVLDLAHRLSAAMVGTAGSLLGRLLAPGDQIESRPAAGSDPMAAEPDRPLNPFTPPGEWFDLLLLVGAGLVFASAYLIFARRRLHPAEWPRRAAVAGRLLRTLLMMLWRVLIDLARALRSILTPVRIAATGPAGRPIRQQVRRWHPEDPIRRRIAADYRLVLEGVGVRWGPRPAAETPEELARRVAADLSLAPAIQDLTDVYERARFSRQPMNSGDAALARRARLAVTEHWQSAPGRERQVLAPPGMSPSEPSTPRRPPP